ncbi:MAG: hypothetical protein H6831_05530 [Planctomycetes bacterium]|nr:hypothetical protein [Planctomycetota bacterium]MCB9903850.1 hypothetical protein [Planctomycetota bacterium]
MNISLITRRLCLPAALLVGSSSAQAQFQFSVDYFGPTIATPDSAFGAPITEGDVLFPMTLLPAYGPLLPPSIDRAAGPGGLPPLDLGLAGYAGCAGHPPGVACTVEVDALSHGRDNPMDPAVPYPIASLIWFSVDRFAVGTPPGLAGPAVSTEAPFGDAATDVFTGFGLLPGPLPPFAVPPANVGIVDGDGLISPSGFVYPGVGIMEGAFNDNLDALDTEMPLGIYPTYFSLEGGLVDPITGVVGSGSALAHGFSSSDILVTPAPGALPGLFAIAGALGLDLFGFGTDDLDALIMFENGTGVFEPPLGPYHWVFGGSDMVLFSVRRGSAVIGSPDSMFGLPIEEGDILMPPIPGGLSPFPAIFIAAENLGLATVRSGFPVLFGDDLDAADSRFAPLNDCDGDGVEDGAAIAAGLAADCNGNGVPDRCDIASGVESDCDGNGVPDSCDIASGVAADCNGNGVPDSCDIANGTSTDFNLDGVPDECGPGTTMCPGDGTLIPCPCSNESTLGAGEGCKNSTGVGAVLYTTGTSVVVLDNLVFHVAQGRPGMPALLVQGSSLISIPFKDGVFCMGGPTERVEVLFLNAAGAGSTSSSIVTNGSIPLAGGVRYYQMWYRDPVISPCGTGSNFTQGLKITWI